MDKVSVLVRIGSIGLAFILLAGLILAAGGSPFEVSGNLFSGAFGTVDQLARVLATLAPMMLCASGLIFTFAAGLYNLGVEGQITLGAVVATGVLRSLYPLLPAGWVIALSILAGGMGGMAWGVLAGGLNVFGRINEIFAGLGLNFMATGLALYLIFGPWKREGIASMSGTELFDDALRLPSFDQTDASPVALGIGVLALVITLVVMRTTTFGLRLRAVGQNSRAAYVLGIPAKRYLLSSFALCGGLAGVAGALQVVGVFHRLIPNISSNLGFLALLVVLLINFNPLWILPVSFFFSALNVGSLQLPSLNLESSLTGVIQGTLVLCVLLGQGIQKQGWFLPKDSEEKNP